MQIYLNLKTLHIGNLHFIKRENVIKYFKDIGCENIMHHLRHYLHSSAHDWLYSFRQLGHNNFIFGWSWVVTILKYKSLIHSKEFPVITMVSWCFLWIILRLAKELLRKLNLSGLCLTLVYLTIESQLEILTGKLWLNVCLLLRWWKIFKKWSQLLWTSTFP